MQTGINYCKNWGGAFFVWLILCLPVRAQVLCLPQLVEFEIVKVLPESPWRAKSTSLNNPGAFQAFYHVNLKARAGNLPTSVSISQLSFNGAVNVNNFTSRINRALTEERLPIPTSPGLTNLGQFLNLDDLANGEVNWEILAGLGCQNQEPPIQITLPANTSSVRLFTIVVDAVPGDFLQWSSFSGWYDDCLNCMGSVFASAVGGNTNILFPQPAISSSPLQLTFEYIPASLNNNLRVRVMAQSPPAFGLGKMDGVIRIIPDMTPSSLEFSIVELTSLGGPTLLDKEIRENMDGSIDVYFSFLDFEDPDNPMPLFDVDISGFYNQSQGGFLDCSLLTGRWTIFPFDSNPVTNRLNGESNVINVQGHSLCSPGITIEGDIYKIPQDCATGVRFVFKHNQPQPISLSYLTFELVFLVPGTTNATPGVITSTIPHASTNGVFTSGSVGYAYSYSYLGQLNLANGAYIDIPFEVERGCIKYFVSIGEGIITGGSTCAFEVALGEDICDPRINGRVLFDNGSEVQHYRVRVESVNNSNYEIESELHCEETFSFCADPAQEPFRLRVLPLSNASYIEGVTTYDCVLITKHILGITPLATPYQKIAANANEQGQPMTDQQAITATDVINIRSCILGQQNNFGNLSAPSWRYVTDQLQLPDNPVQGVNPPYMTANVIDVPANGLPIDYGSFKAIKMGDVNQTANGGCSSRPGNLSNGFFKTSEIRHVEKDGSVLIPIALNSSTEAIAAQLGLRFDPNLLKLKAIHPNPALMIGDIHFGRQKEEVGELRFAWDSPDGFTTLAKEDWLFTLEFESKNRNQSSQDYQIWSSDHILPGFIYDTEGNEYASKLNPVRERTTDGNKLGAIVAPNPFQHQILTYVYAETAAKARIAVQDAKGQVVLEQVVDLMEGDNTLELSVDHAVSAGVYFLILESDLGRVVRRLTKV